jgi:hypothetical protein
MLGSAYVGRDLDHCSKIYVQLRVVVGDLSLSSLCFSANLMFDLCFIPSFIFLVRHWLIELGQRSAAPRTFRRIPNPLNRIMQDVSSASILKDLSSRYFFLLSLQFESNNGSGSVGVLLLLLSVARPHNI